jgi:hypothetical protein
MNNFEEFLQDYEAHELEQIEKSIKKVDEGKLPLDESYPPKDRFTKLKEPIADPFVNIWGIVPFYGSTIAKLIPKDNRKSFDKIHEDTMGFNSSKIDEMIDFQKETGRIQFAFTRLPTEYKNLEFLEHVFSELKPPTLSYDSVPIIGEELTNKYNLEFETIANFGFSEYLQNITASLGNSDPNYTYAKLQSYATRYGILKASGYEELADEIGTLMILEPEKAHEYISLFGMIIADPKTSQFKSIKNFDNRIMSEYVNTGNEFGIQSNDEFPYEIGKFLLEKMTLYPETMSGCTKIIQEYDDQELYKVFGALNEGVRKNNIDVLESKKEDMSEILDNVWNDTKRIKQKADGIKFGVSLSLGLIGGLAEGLLGTGVMAGLGYAASNTVWGMQDDSISENVAKKVSPNHLVSIYDFQTKHDLIEERISLFTAEVFIFNFPDTLTLFLIS